MKVRLTSPLENSGVTIPAGAVVDVSTETGQQLVAAGHEQVPDSTPDKKDASLYPNSHCLPTAPPAAAPRAAVPPPSKPADKA